MFRRLSDRSFFLLLIPLAAASVPSLIFCVVSLVLRLRGHAAGVIPWLRMPANPPWDDLSSLGIAACDWVAHWNSLITLAATAFLVSTLLLRRWRHFAALALIPYGLLLCADFTLRWL